MVSFIAEAELVGGWGKFPEDPARIQSKTTEGLAHRIFGQSQTVERGLEKMYRMKFARAATWAATVMAAASAVQADPGLTTLATFNQANGATPQCTLIFDSTGNLYGTTWAGGLNNEGTVFELPVAQNSITTLVTFNYYNGQNPGPGLIADKTGNLYGTTSTSNSGEGTVFMVSAGGGSVATLAPIAAGGSSSLIADADANLYGTTFYGGAGDYGTVFKVLPGDGSLTMASFNVTNGAYPHGSLIIDKEGNLYGTTSGGTVGAGTVFEVNGGSGLVTTLAGFNGANGAHPFGGLTADSTGNLYGTTWSGGLYNAGTVFELPAGSSSIITLASFNGINGAHPLNGLIFDAAGNLYGTASSGGTNNDGTVFELPAGAGSIVALATFDSANGSAPYGGLVADTDGNLYGTTSVGGADGAGTIFELADTGFVTAEPEPAGVSLLGIAGSALLCRWTRSWRGNSCKTTG